MSRRLHDYSASASALASRLRAAGCVFADDEARLLIEAARSSSELDELARRRIEGEPLEHVIGWAMFCGHRVRVGPGVFVPRPRSEFLVARAVELLDSLDAAANAGRRAVVIDMCCGSGAIGLAVAAARIEAGVELHACDIDPVAVSWAATNLRDLSAYTVVHTYVGNLFEPLPAKLQGNVDLVVANVPYVPTSEIELLPQEARDHEPLATLDGGNDGLDMLRAVADAARQWLRDRGCLLVETSEHQESAALDAFHQRGFDAGSNSNSESSAVVVTGRWQAKSLHT